MTIHFAWMENYIIFEKKNANQPQSDIIQNSPPRKTKSVDVVRELFGAQASLSLVQQRLFSIEISQHENRYFAEPGYTASWSVLAIALNYLTATNKIINNYLKDPSKNLRIQTLFQSGENFWECTLIVYFALSFCTISGKRYSLINATNEVY